MSYLGQPHPVSLSVIYSDETKMEKAHFYIGYLLELSLCPCMSSSWNVFHDREHQACMHTKGSKQVSFRNRFLILQSSPLISCVLFFGMTQDASQRALLVPGAIFFLGGVRLQYSLTLLPLCNGLHTDNERIRGEL